MPILAEAQKAMPLIKLIGPTTQCFAKFFTVSSNGEQLEWVIQITNSRDPNAAKRDITYAVFGAQ